MVTQRFSVREKVNHMMKPSSPKANKGWHCGKTSTISKTYYNLDPTFSKKVDFSHFLSKLLAMKNTHWCVCTIYIQKRWPINSHIDSVERNKFFHTATIAGKMDIGTEKSLQISCTVEKFTRGGKRGGRSNESCMQRILMPTWQISKKYALDDGRTSRNTDAHEKIEDKRYEHDKPKLTTL